MKNLIKNMAGGAFFLTVFFIASYFISLNWRNDEVHLNSILVITSFGISLGALFGAIIRETKIPTKLATVLCFFLGGFFLRLL